jgi:hypothetical protein
MKKGRLPKNETVEAVKWDHGIGETTKPNQMSTAVSGSTKQDD